MNDMSDQSSNRFRNLPDRVVSGEIQSSTCSPRPKQTTVPSDIRKLIAELGLRYEPSAKADLQAHAARMALLSRDLAEARADLLDEAIRMWVSRKDFLPRANELIAMMQSILDRRAAVPQREDMADQVERLNEMSLSKAQGWRWFLNYRMDDGQKRWFIDRADDREMHGRKAWEPEPGEMEAIHAKVAEYIADGWTQEEFNKHVRRTGGRI